MKSNLLVSGYQANLIRRFLFKVFPKVNKELNFWIKQIHEFNSDQLAHQAINSIKMKKFHCQGGSIYSLYPYCNTNRMVELIVSLQTISDYLDNLCDRSEVKEEKAFRQLHLAFIEALVPDDNVSDYYLYYPFKEDGGYLNTLVRKCKSCIRDLPSYMIVQEQTIRLGKLYSELQIYKHLPLSLREKKVMDWAKPYLEQYNDISIWEFAAATGSTLGIFILFAMASDERCSKEEVIKVIDAYFPWICGLHILLDYYIDLKEDKKWGDLNFISYYSDLNECENRINLFIDNSLQQIKELSNTRFHLTVIQGLLALYLSDRKALSNGQADISHKLISRRGNMVKFLWKICRHLRKKNII